VLATNRSDRGLDEAVLFPFCNLLTQATLLPFGAIRDRNRKTWGEYATLIAPKISTYLIYCRDEPSLAINVQFKIRTLSTFLVQFPAGNPVLSPVGFPTQWSVVEI